MLDDRVATKRRSPDVHCSNRPLKCPGYAQLFSLPTGCPIVFRMEPVANPCRARTGADGCSQPVHRAILIRQAGLASVGKATARKLRQRIRLTSHGKGRVLPASASVGSPVRWRGGPGVQHAKSHDKNNQTLIGECECL